MRMLPSSRSAVDMLRGRKHSRRGRACLSGGSATLYSIATATLNGAGVALTFNSASGSDGFTLDQSAGSPLPNAGVTINGAGQVIVSLDDQTCVLNLAASAKRNPTI